MFCDQVSLMSFNLGHFVVFHDLGTSKDYRAVILLNALQFGVIWYFLNVRSKLYIL